MNTLKQAQEIMKGCNMPSSGEPNCERGQLCFLCEAKAETLKQACEEFLEFVESQVTICQGTQHEDGTYSDLKKGEKSYNPETYEKIIELKQTIKLLGKDKETFYGGSNF